MKIRNALIGWSIWIYICAALICNTVGKLGGTHLRHYTPWAIASRAMNPGYGWCLRCGAAWPSRKDHYTGYGAGNYSMGVWMGRSCFPLCESCWQALTREQRWPYYRQLVEVWEQDGGSEGNLRTSMWQAVMEGR